jgi:hypothetical protein
VTTRHLPRLPLLAAALCGVLLGAGPAHAANPVLDPEDDADLAASLAEASEVQDVCYGYVLQVTDADTGEWGGTYAASSAGADVPASTAGGCDEVVELVARIDYPSSFSEAEDSASWDLVSTLPELSIADVEALGLSSGDLLDDGRSATALLNAVQSLPRLAAEQAGRPPVVLEANTAPLPADARPTGTPGSDWLRENAALLALSVAAIVAGLVAFRASRPRGRTRPPRVTRLGPPPPSGPRSADPWSSALRQT